MGRETEKTLASGNLCHQQTTMLIKYVSAQRKRVAALEFSSCRASALPVCSFCMPIVLALYLPSHTFRRASMPTSMLSGDIPQTPTASFPLELVKTRYETTICSIYKSLGDSKHCWFHDLLRRWRKVFCCSVFFGVKMALYCSSNAMSTPTIPSPAASQQDRSRIFRLCHLLPGPGLLCKMR